MHRCYHGKNNELIQSGVSSWIAWHQHEFNRIRTATGMSSHLSWNHYKIPQHFSHDVTPQTFLRHHPLLPRSIRPTSWCLKSIKWVLSSAPSTSMQFRLHSNLTFLFPWAVFFSVKALFFECRCYVFFFWLLPSSYPVSPIDAKQRSALSVFYTLASLDQASCCFFLTFPPSFCTTWMILVLKGAWE